MVAGHVFPFYLGFRGGRGAATSAGLLMLSLSWLMLDNPLCFLPEIGFLTVAIGTLWITRNDYLLALVELPLLTCLVLKRYYPRTEATAAALLSTYVFGISLFHYRRESRTARGLPPHDGRARHSPAQSQAVPLFSLTPLALAFGVGVVVGAEIAGQAAHADGDVLDGG